MCRSANPDIILPDKEYIGYKVVAKNKRSGNYYSAVIGFKYPVDGDIPVKRVQKCLINNVYDDILGEDVKGFFEKLKRDSGYLGFRRYMLGRTTLFNSLEYAQLYMELNPLKCTYRDFFDLVVVKCSISKDVIDGNHELYNNECYETAPCRLGRHLRIHKEVT